MNEYEAHQEARRERLEAAAQRTKEEAAARFKSAERGYGINFKDIERGAKLEKKAQELARRAESVGSGGISSDDPDAVTKIRAEIEKLEAQQKRMVAANKLIRKNDREGLAAMGFSEGTINQLFQPDFCGRLGFPDYATTNNGANIRRLKKRIEEIEARDQTPPAATIEGDGWSIEESAEENRVIIRFDAKPSREKLSELRSAGFKWSPTRGAHVRMRSNAATYWAKRIVGVPQ
jgi:hypothetical protein